MFIEVNQTPVIIAEYYDSQAELGHYVYNVLVQPVQLKLDETGFSPSHLLTILPNCLTSNGITGFVFIRERKNYSYKQILKNTGSCHK